jgi:hypothetical protein
MVRLRSGRRDRPPVRTTRRPGLQSGIPLASPRGAAIWPSDGLDLSPVRSVSEDVSRHALFRGEGLTDAQPREGEFRGSHCGAESLGGARGGLGGGIGGGLDCGPARGVLADVVGCGGCCGHRNEGLREDGLRNWAAGGNLIAA